MQELPVNFFVILIGSQCSFSERYLIRPREHPIQSDEKGSGNELKMLENLRAKGCSRRGIEMTSVEIMNDLADISLLF